MFITPETYPHLQGLDGDGVISIDEQQESNEYTLAERQSFWYQGASPKTQLSRVSASPIRLPIKA
jgi:hypothetical protein